MRKFKTTRNERAKIRYGIYRQLGYSVEESRSKRWSSEYDITGLRVGKNGQVVRGGNYQKILKSAKVDVLINPLRRFDYPSVYSRHGYLVSEKNPAKMNQNQKDYYKAVRYIRQLNNFSPKARYKNEADDKSFYYAWYMLENDRTYSQAQRELLAKTDYEHYVQPRTKPRGRIKK